MRSQHARRRAACCSASTSATKPPVIDAVRVPPSAWMTSQSIQIVRSPSSVSRVDRAQRAADQPLDLLRAAADLAGAGLALRARRRGARQHAVFGRDPALAGVAQERRHAVLDARRADRRACGRPRSAPSLRRASRKPGVMRRRAQLSGGAPVDSRGHQSSFSVLTHFRFFASGCRRSTWPASVSTSLPSTRICTREIAGRFTVSALTIA